MSPKLGRAVGLVLFAATITGCATGQSQHQSLSNNVPSLVARERAPIRASSTGFVQVFNARAGIVCEGAPLGFLGARFAVFCSLGKRAGQPAVDAIDPVYTVSAEISLKCANMVTSSGSVSIDAC